MFVQRCLLLTISICLVLSVEFGAVQAERWSRQVSNSEWIPLPDPRASQTQIEQNNPSSGLVASGTAQLPQLPQLSLPPTLQQQYQEQLLQLQKTQESIQKLLLLQQQLRTQQQLLQSQAFLPSGFSNPEEDKRQQQAGLHSHTGPDLAPEDLVPPLPATDALPPVFPAQNFLPQRPRAHPPPPSPPKQDREGPQEYATLPGQSFKNGHLVQQGQNVDVGQLEQIQENQRPGAKHLKDGNQAFFVPQSEHSQDEEEEVQLVYVPAETLAQRGQPKRGRGRKQHPHRQQQQQAQQQHHHHRENQGVEQTAISHDQDAFSRQLLQQIQMEREEKTQFLKEERMKEIARLNEEQRALERKARLQQEALQREQELQRQREAEKKKKELERLEEMAKQRELERIREAREKQRLEELERRRLAEVRAKEEKRRAEEAARQREAERLAAMERQKELEIQEALKQQQLLDKQREDEARATSALSQHQDVQSQALPLIRDQQDFHRQHVGSTKPARSKIRTRHRQRNQYQEQQSYREPTTTPSPNQPPLSVYMGNSHSKANSARVSDVLKILKDAKTIAVLDTVGPDTPQVFVGPTSLDPPIGYAKFDLPYLSSIDHNRVERKVDKLPFFVAPLSFDPPPGYSKIPFPSPHIGSVVVNTLDNTDPKDGDDQNPSPTPLIEPNSYSDGLDGGPDPTTALYEPQTTAGYSQDVSSTPSSGYSGSRFRFRQFYGDSKPASVISTAYYEDQRPTTRKHKYYDDSSRTTESSVQRPRVETSVSQIEDVSYSTTPSYKDVDPQDPSTKSQDLTAQLALINQELAQQRESQRYNPAGQYGQDNSHSTSGLSNSFESEITAGDLNDVRAPIGPTQYSLPAELPAISPHLPGLVNSLLDRNEGKLQASTVATPSTTPSTTTTSTTTQRTPTTTYRTRGRQRNRVVSTRPRTTTQAPSTRSTTDRNRRPYNRSRSRYTTTTEEYRESAYEPSKSRIPETTLKYNTEHRRPSSRTQKYRNREKTLHQAELLVQNQEPQTQQAYENLPHSDSPTTGNAYLQPSGPDGSLNDFSPENYPSSTVVSTTENYPTSLRDATVNHGSPLVSDDYSRHQNYPQSLPEQSNYRGGYDQATLQQTGLEKTPVNGFNYQAQSGDPLDQGILQRPKDYQLDGKAENSDYELATTADPRSRIPDEQRYSSIYEVNVPQGQPEYSLTGQDNLHRLESEKIQSAVIHNDPNEQPIFVPLPENKQEDYELPISSTELTLSDITTETTTTSTTPVVIRQRLRGRISTRVNHEPTVQTRNRGSQDEYVRFNVVNQDSTRTSHSRQRNRPRTRAQSHGSQVQTDGNEYIKIHAVQQQRQIATTTIAPSTITTTTPPPEEDIDYGFIRPPNFRPVHPVDNRFPAPVTYRPQLSEVPQQSLLPSEGIESVESNPQTQLLKTRQKYQPTPNRRLSGKPTTLPPTTTPSIEAATTTERIPVATILPDDAIYTVKSKSRPDEPKQTRVRSRIRRPVKKRVTTTSTTESVLEAHNELPLDENYPRIAAQPSTTEQQPNLYDDNYDGQFPSSRNPTAHQFYESSSENYPSEFVLNFGNYPDQGSQREEYDQTQLASNAQRKYSQPSLAKSPSDDAHSTTADIYGAESQWSTKLTRTSFQPSRTANQVAGEQTKDHEWFHESLKDLGAPEIITAEPEVSSVTLVVSSDDKRSSEEDARDEESMLMGTTDFGRKTAVQDHTEEARTTSFTGAPTTITQNKNNDQTETWLSDKVENSTEQQTAIDFAKIQKKPAGPPAVRKVARRRRVRVRVRPAVDDFVTAESQHFNSAVNGLVREQYKYSSKHPTTTESSSSEESILQDFLTEILKEGKTPARPTTTETPEAAWTMSPAMTTPIVIPDDVEETTANEIQTTTMPTTDRLQETTTAKSSYEDMITQPTSEGTSSTEEDKGDETKKLTSQNQWEKSVQDALDLGLLAEKYTAKDNDVDKPNESAESIQSDEDAASTRSKTIDSDDSFGDLDDEKEGGSESFEKDQESREDNYAHPKNHRAKWSEVRYPSAFDRSLSRKRDPKASVESSIPGLVTKNEGDASVKTLSDYVKAIFDTMKSVEEETTVADTEKPETTTTSQIPTEAEFSTKDPSVRDTTETIIPTTETPTTLERVATTSEIATDPPTTTTPKLLSTTVASNATESILGKVLRTSTTTRVSHMTEICYRGRCVMTRPSQDDRFR
ncbi:uncharacterized protein LOC143342731 [Colletes latitarsis]|uniref:uncharacterized protein LOC143342731 n=1 Tax=Colletes latitarsis TaxID=2605962 RepID=UPI004035FC2F